MGVTLDTKIFSDDLEEKIEGVQKLANDLCDDVFFEWSNVTIRVGPDLDKMRSEMRAEKSEWEYERSMEG